MKKIILSLLAASVAMFAYAQNYEQAKNMLAINQFKKAKEEVDKGMANTKYASKPEAYILKATIYAALSMDNEFKNTATGLQYLRDAEAAFAKYKEMQPELTLMKDPIYQNGPINLYSGLFSSGYKDYQAKNWQASFETFRKVVDISDLLIKEKVLTVAADTNSLILAGVTAESSKNEDAAANYYARLAELKLADKDYESIYRYMVNYNYKRKNMAEFDKYRNLGKQLYPNSEFFSFDKVDFAAGLEDDFNKKVKAIEDIIAAEPGNYKAQLQLGGVIYDTLNPRDETSPVPANFEELESKMMTALKAANTLDPKSEHPLIYMGSHFVNKAKRVNEQRKAHAAEMKARTKPGTQASKEDIKKRDDLDVLYGKTLDGSLEPYEKAAALYASKGNLSLKDKQQYKYIVNDLSEIYSYKKIQAKGKPAEAAKYAAEEKKWNDLYETIK